MILEEAVRCVVDPRVKSEARTGLRAALSLTLGVMFTTATCQQDWSGVFERVFGLGSAACVRTSEAARNAVGSLMVLAIPPIFVS